MPWINTRATILFNTQRIIVLQRHPILLDLEQGGLTL